jgi:transcriptional antiterminator RfaH
MVNNVSTHSEALTSGRNKTAAWFCVRSQPKHEHIAAAHLTRSGIDVFHPRIRFTRPTRRGPVAFTESLFPNYLFARFDWEQSLHLVQYINGVTDVVHFGGHWPTIPQCLIDDLRKFFGHDSVREICSAPKVGDTVIISNGAFEGLEAIVTRVLPGSQRVAVLLHFLGRQSTVELSTADLVPNTRDQLGRQLNFSNVEPSTAQSQFR